jgi:hypothetical protein
MIELLELNEKDQGRLASQRTSIRLHLCGSQWIGLLHICAGNCARFLQQSNQSKQGQKREEERFDREVAV